MKKVAPFVLLLLLLPLISAQSIEVKEINKGSTIISELSNPAVFDLVIINHGEEENFQIYSLTTPISPSSKIKLKQGENIVEIMATLGEQFRNNLGFFTFEYEVKRQSGETYKDSLLLKIVPFKDVFEVTTEPINKNSQKAKIKNTQNTNLNNINFNLETPFFTKSQTLNFKPNEEIEVEAEINKDFSKLKAGPYILNIKVEAENREVEEEGIINYLENEETFSDKKSSGFIVKKTTLEKTNIGNTEVTETLTLNKDVISRLFTLNSPAANKVERTGLSTTYTWENSLEPGESLIVESTTNYTFPFIILLAIILAGFGAKSYSKQPLAINKKVSLVKTKGGELALKVNLKIKAKENLEKVRLVDILPAMTKLYDKFGRQPDEINAESRTLVWNVNSMSKGEERFFSYIIYSKLKIVGRFELPTAHASYEKDGEKSRTISNHAFFAEEISEH